MSRNRAITIPLLVLTLCASCATTVPRRVPYAVTSRQFEAEDSIVLREVVSTSGGLRMGDKVVVRGEYQLRSRPSAALCLFISTSQPTGWTVVSPRQKIEVEAGRGTFELEHEIRYAGALHVSFYGAPAGGSFGGVYFGEAK